MDEFVSKAEATQAIDVPDSGGGSPDDDALLEQLRQGSALALRTLYDKYAPCVLRSLRSAEFGAVGPEDCCQEAFFKLFFQPPKSAHKLEGWLVRVAHNHAIDTARSSQARAQGTRDALPRIQMFSARSEEINVRRAELNTLLKHFQRLPDRDRKVLALRYLPRKTELTLEEIAKQSGLPQSTVRGILERAKKKLRKLCRDYEQLLPVTLVAAGVTAGVLLSGSTAEAAGSLRKMKIPLGIALLTVLGGPVLWGGGLCHYERADSQYTSSSRGPRASRDSATYRRGATPAEVHPTRPPERLFSSVGETSGVSAPRSSRQQSGRRLASDDSSRSREGRAERQWQRLTSISLRLVGTGRRMHSNHPTCESESAIRIQPVGDRRFAIRGTLIPVSVTPTSQSGLTSLGRTTNNAAGTYYLGYNCDGTRDGAEFIMLCANWLYELRPVDEARAEIGGTASHAGLLSQIVMDRDTTDEEVEGTTLVPVTRYGGWELVAGQVTNERWIMGNSWPVQLDRSEVGGQTSGLVSGNPTPFSLSDMASNSPCSIVASMSIVPLDTAAIITRTCDSDPEFDLCRKIRPIHVARPTCAARREGIEFDILGTDPWTGRLRVRTSAGVNYYCGAHRCAFRLPDEHGAMFTAEGPGLMLFEPFIATLPGVNGGRPFYAATRQLLWRCQGMRSVVAVDSIDNLDPDQIPYSRSLISCPFTCQEDSQAPLRGSTR